MRIGAIAFGLLSLALLLYLLVGLLLPGTWEAQAEDLVPAPPAEVFPLLNDLQAWSDWNPMPETGTTTFGAPKGAGAGLRWDDPQYGSGEVRIVASKPHREVRYRVDIEGGRMTILGTLILDPTEGGTLIRWREEGDFGWNPLLGYAARRMGSSQAEAMAENLETLAEILSGSTSR